MLVEPSRDGFCAFLGENLFEIAGDKPSSCKFRRGTSRLPFPDILIDCNKNFSNETNVEELAFISSCLKSAERQESVFRLSSGVGKPFATFVWLTTIIPNRGSTSCWHTS